MAVAYQTLNVQKYGYVKIASPDTHFSVSATGEYVIRETPANDIARMFFGTSAFPSNLKRKAISEVRVTVRTRADAYYGRYLNHYVYVHSSSDFNANTITWNSAPPISSGYRYNSSGADTSGWVDIEVVFDKSSNGYLATGVDIIQNRAFAVEDGNQFRNLDYSYIMPTLGGSIAMVKVTYDPDTDVKSKLNVTSSPSNNHLSINEAKFEWTLEANGGRCANETFNQTSAVFKYKAYYDANWTTVNISGNTKKYTISANTLPSASTIYWELSTVDEDGTTGSASGSFSTARTTAKAVSYPAGSNFDTRKQTEVSWTLKYSDINYPQKSAAFLWKKSGDSAWNRIAASPSSQKSLIVPANTFPTAETILWYVEATDSGGYAATTAVSSFTTVTTIVKATVFPDGNNVNPSVEIPFEWLYDCYYRDYDQKSVKLQWRRSDEPDWHDISISGNIKTYKVPENTFSTASTIQWRIVGTDSGDHVSQTNVSTFNTLSTQVTQQGGPTSGYCDPRNAITFSWYYPCTVGDYSQQSAVFHWKESTATDWVNVEITGDQKSVTIPANTFPVASNIQWYIEGTDAGGTSSSTPQFEFSTTAETAFAYCNSPVGRVVDGTKKIKFEWITINSDGSDPTRTVIQWKYNTESSNEWKNLLDTVEVTREYIVGERFFSAGTIEWKVFVYNRDGIKGPENQASFVCLVAPDAPSGLSATPVPRTLIRWQSTGQEAYEISIDGKIVKKEYGPGIYSYQKNEPLEDGIHTISVRVQGVYGLWSNSAETTILVSNDPQTTISLSAAFNIDASLHWRYESPVSNAKAQIYRDNKRIAAVGDATSFLDRLAIGEHSYFVELWEENGNYSRSNIVTGTMETQYNAIAEAEGGNWLTLRLSDDSEAAQLFTWEQTHAFQHVSGCAYPVLEIGFSEDFAGSYDCSFDNELDAAAFEKLKGKIVVMKSRKGNVLIGALLSYIKSVREFFVSYTFNIQKVDWEDFVSYDENN